MNITAQYAEYDSVRWERRVFIAVPQRWCPSGTTPPSGALRHDGEAPPDGRLPHGAPGSAPHLLLSRRPADPLHGVDHHPRQGHPCWALHCSVGTWGAFCPPIDFLGGGDSYPKSQGDLTGGYGLGDCILWCQALRRLCIIKLPSCVGPLEPEQERNAFSWQRPFHDAWLVDAWPVQEPPAQGR